MYKQIFALTLLATVINAETTGWTDCGSPHATIHRLRVGDCQETPCSFIRGHSYIIEVDATAHSDSSSLLYEMSVFVILNIILREGNACESLQYGATCPVQAGNHFTYRIYYEVPVWLPMVSATVRSQLWHDSGEVGICIDVDGIVTLA